MQLTIKYKIRTASDNSVQLMIHKRIYLTYTIIVTPHLS